MKRSIALVLVLLNAAVWFAVGYRCCYLRFLREAEFYVDREMIVIDLDNDYNETYLTGQWPDDYRRIR